MYPTSDQVAQVVTEFQSQFDVWVHNQLFNNQFLVAGVGTLLLGVIGYLLRSLPKRIWAWLMRVSTVTLTVNSDTGAFIHVLRRLDKSRIRFLQRTFLLMDGSDDDDEWDGDCAIPKTKRMKWSLGPGYGGAIFTFERRPVFGHLAREKSDSHSFKMIMSLRFVGRSSTRIRRFMRAVHEDSLKVTDTLNVYSAAGGRWSGAVFGKAKRPLSSVFMAEADKAKIIERMNWFYANEDWYRTRGLPYKMGIMLTGAPGVGKSSLIHALASEFHKNIRLLNLNTMTDTSSTTIGGSLGVSDLLVIEDIDTFSVANKRKAQKEQNKSAREKRAAFRRAVKEAGIPQPPDNEDDLADEFGKEIPESGGDGGEKDSGFRASLSSILNLLDGLVSPDGVITIATTNHPEVLDKALIRKGRFDLHVELGPLDAQSFTEMFVAFYGEDKKALVESFLASGRYVPVVGAVAQDLFRHETAEDALRILAKHKSNGQVSSGDEHGGETDHHGARISQIPRAHKGN